MGGGERLNDLAPDEVRKQLSATNKGEVLPTTNNFIQILSMDRRFSRLVHDELRAAPAKRMSPGITDLWTDADDAAARAYIERVYGIRSPGKQADAFRIVTNERRMNPVAEMIEATKWDGVPRVSDFLVRWLKVPDTEYSRECSRLLFAQGIKRTYEPGCKAESVIVLQGKQGSGKSTLCQWLALDDRFFSSVKTIAGQRGYEAIAGKFVCELEELLAVAANQQGRREEEVKAFLSTGTDHFRQPYDRFAADYPRHCVFIGTTNSPQFLTDPTGNRRWFPIRCGVATAADMYAHEAECKAAIRQAWAEMLVSYRKGEAFASPAPDPRLSAMITRQQEEAEVEDPRIGIILEYCKAKMQPTTPRQEPRDRVCLAEIWNECLHSSQSSKPEFTVASRREIGDLLRCKIGLIPSGLNTAHFAGYGRQKYFTIPAEVMERYTEQAQK